MVMLYTGSEVVEANFKVCYKGISELGFVISPPRVEHATVELLMDEEFDSGNRDAKMYTLLEEKCDEWISERITDFDFTAKILSCDFVVRDLCIVSENVTKQCKIMRDICSRGFPCLASEGPDLVYTYLEVSKQSSVLRNICARGFVCLVPVREWEELEDIVAAGEAYLEKMELEVIDAVWEEELEVIDAVWEEELEVVDAAWEEESIVLVAASS